MKTKSTNFVWLTYDQEIKKNIEFLFVIFLGKI